LKSEIGFRLFLQIFNEGELGNQAQIEILLDE